MNDGREINAIVKTYFASLLLLFILCLVISKGQDVLWVNRYYCNFTDSLFSLITHLGEGYVLVPALIVCFFKSFKNAIAFVCIQGVLGIIIAVSKRVLFPDAARPISYLDPNLLHFISDVKVYSHHSFPSGHTATAFSVALFLSLIVRRRLVTMGLTFMAVLVGYSRIYLLQHFLVDVTAGAITGTLTSLAAYIIISDRTWPRWMDKRFKFRLPQGKNIQPMGN
jgi:membrane-associated phospholipid phosphatase